MTIDALKNIRYDESEGTPQPPKFRQGQYVMRDTWATHRKVARVIRTGQGVKYWIYVPAGGWRCYEEHELTAYQEDERLQPHPKHIGIPEELLADLPTTTNKKATDMTTITLKLNKDEQDAARNDDWDFIHNKIRSALPPHLEQVFEGQQFTDGERTYKVEHLGKTRWWNMPTGRPRSHGQLRRPKTDGTEPTLALCSVNGTTEQFTIQGIRGLVAEGSWVEVTDASE